MAAGDQWQLKPAAARELAEGATLRRFSRITASEDGHRQGRRTDGSDHDGSVGRPFKASLRKRLEPSSVESTTPRLFPAAVCRSDPAELVRGFVGIHVMSGEDRRHHLRDVGWRYRDFPSYDEAAAAVRSKLERYLVGSNLRAVNRFAPRRAAPCASCARCVLANQRPHLSWDSHRRLPGGGTSACRGSVRSGSKCAVEARVVSEAAVAVDGRRAIAERECVAKEPVATVVRLGRVWQRMKPVAFCTACQRPEVIMISPQVGRDPSIRVTARPCKS